MFVKKNNKKENEKKSIYFLELYIYINNYII